MGHPGSGVTAASSPCPSRPGPHPRPAPLRRARPAHPCTRHHGRRGRDSRLQREPGSDGSAVTRAQGAAGPQPGSTPSPGTSATWGRSSEGTCGRLRPEFQKPLLLWPEQTDRWAGTSTGGPQAPRRRLKPHWCHICLCRQGGPLTACAACLGGVAPHTLAHAEPAENRCTRTSHLPVPVARVTGDAVVQAPVGQRLLLIEDKLLQLHLHFRAGHSAWLGRKHGAVTRGSARGRPLPAAARPGAGTAGLSHGTGGCRHHGSPGRKDRACGGLTRGRNAPG